ncbi:hypothetical protein ABZ490_13950 [Streptomyces sp. NPDC005811]|uniref:hypothetical protein n=1 Tax=Streptomyces sp. NPDC005811 TaxID=3154565 RepID=UPI0033C49F7E
MTESSSSSTPPGASADGVVDEALGVFARDVLELSDGTMLDSDFHSLTLPLDGQSVDLLLQTQDPTEARSLLPRLRRAVEHRTELRRRAVEAVVTTFSTEPPTAEDLAEAAADLLTQAIVVDGTGEVILHFTDSCGRHLLDGYWPAVRFDEADAVIDVTVES